MNNWRLVKLNFGKNVAHFGELGIGIEETSERVYSDTLFSAWINAYAKLRGKESVSEILEQFLDIDNIPFSLSSTFIYQQPQKETKTIYYLPRPLCLPSGYPTEEEGGDLAFFKTFKKLKYLPIDIWQRWYQGNGFSENDRNELIVKTIKSANTSQVLTKAGTFQYKDNYKFSKLPKVSIDRVTHASNFYHTGFVQYRWEENYSSGLYFLVNFLDSEWENTFFEVLEFLGDEGLGGERSSGAGRFQYTRKKTLSKQWNKVLKFNQSSYHSLLSLFWTDDSFHLQQLLGEEDKPIASYELKERGGWIGSYSSDGRQLRRKKVHMFAEGSVFSKIPRGKLANVKPQGFNDHNVYRSGISLSLPIKILIK
ncbi:Type III-A CRISPR-associated RAMP protein Csm4 [Hyella patelloides LEGE 07179]|uniref:CRISPR system Cms protein Csm4 n=1 Tax=Hyella patelloides LEGE 07179 TaxID=945734 RepID=A0A563W3A3_9CYAN|nr:type III-A CRISPR-associated RAMP protein Csm4 [Hyella patelloides]VEP18162.1 Type III-A CRISPR-associated RAMP protein Csm4 [Hyella patelloides LEGE 07179]